MTAHTHQNFGYKPLHDWKEVFSQILTLYTNQIFSPTTYLTWYWRCILWLRPIFLPVSGQYGKEKLQVNCSSINLPWSISQIWYIITSCEYIGFWCRPRLHIFIFKAKQIFPLFLFSTELIKPEQCKAQTSDNGWYREECWVGLIWSSIAEFPRSLYYQCRTREHTVTVFYEKWNTQDNWEK